MARNTSKSRIGTNPLDLLIPAKQTSPAQKSKPAPAPKPAPVARERLTVQLDADTVERAKNAAFWERTTVADIVAEGIRMVVDKLEKQRGEPFETRTQSLRAGRPTKRK